MILTVLSLPFMIRQPIDLPPIVSVELIQISDKTISHLHPKLERLLKKAKKRKEWFRTGTASAKAKKSQMNTFAR